MVNLRHNDVVTLFGEVFRFTSPCFWGVGKAMHHDDAFVGLWVAKFKICYRGDITVTSAPLNDADVDCLECDIAYQAITCTHGTGLPPPEEEGNGEETAGHATQDEAEPLKQDAEEKRHDGKRWDRTEKRLALPPRVSEEGDLPD